MHSDCRGDGGEVGSLVVVRGGPVVGGEVMTSGIKVGRFDGDEVGALVGEADGGAVTPLLGGVVGDEVAGGGRILR